MPSRDLPPQEYAQFSLSVAVGTGTVRPITRIRSSQKDGRIFLLFFLHDHFSV